MRRAFICACILAVVATVPAQTGIREPAAQSMQEFWKKFQTAIVKSDKEAVAAMSAFPIAMPFGFNSIRTKAQFMKNYRTIFFSEGNAAKCFPKAKLDVDRKKPNVFEVGCSMNGGNSEEEPLVYTFKRGRNGWRFVGFDNINE